MDDKNQEINESNASKRLRMLGENMDEKIHSEDDEIKKGSFFDNLWYQHKWTIIITSFLLIVFLIFMVITIKDCKKEPDVKIYYAGPVQISDTSSHNLITNALTQISKDYNGKGGTIVQLMSETLYASNQMFYEDGTEFSTQEKGYHSANVNSFKQKLMGGEIVVLFIDKELYDEHFKGQFVPLADLGIDAGEAQYDSCSFYLKDTEFGSYYNAFDKLPDDTLVVVNQKLWNADEGEYNDQIDYLKALINFKKPE